MDGWRRTRNPKLGTRNVGRDTAMNWKTLFLPLTPLYSAVVRARAAAYAGGLFPEHRLGVPVVSVGNLTFGGTGKTPTVVALARDLVQRGMRPAILTRGYKRSIAEPMVIVGPDHTLEVEQTGDEPLEMAGRLPGVPIVVDADRVRGGRVAIETGADILLLDDGFQHLRLARDLNLVLVDAGDPWGGGQLPPRGRLREPLQGLTRASAVLVTKVAGPDDPALTEIQRRVSTVAGEIPLFAAQMSISRVRTADGWKPPGVLDGQPVVAFAGLGRPGGFVQLIGDAGARVVAHRWFADHHRYTDTELEEVVAQAQRQGAVAVTTGKDAVKLPGEAAVWVVEAEMVPVNGSWDELWRLLPKGGS